MLTVEFGLSVFFLLGIRQLVNIICWDFIFVFQGGMLILFYRQRKGVQRIWLYVNQTLDLDLVLFDVNYFVVTEFCVVIIYIYVGTEFGSFLDIFSDIQGEEVIQIIFLRLF